MGLHVFNLGDKATIAHTKQNDHFQMFLVKIIMHFIFHLRVNIMGIREACMETDY